MDYRRQTEGESVDFVSLPALTSPLVHPALTSRVTDQGIQVEVRMGYLTITSRHQDGFSTPDTALSD
jgi:hypothetical protein